MSIDTVLNVYRPNVSPYQNQIFKEWEKETPYFQACLPIEVMATSGIDTLRFGPMKPVGLRNPHDYDRRPHAVVQLRPDNLSQTLYNMVGFQTKMTYFICTPILPKCCCDS